MKIGDKREKIIQAATFIFAEKGFHEAKISEIAEIAGVADGTIYLYFKNKTDILLAIFEEEVAKIISKINQNIIKTDDPLEKLLIFIKLYFNMLMENKDLALLLQTELRRGNEYIKEYHEQKFSEYLKIIFNIIVEGQTKGIFRDDFKPEFVVSAIYGAIDEVSRLVFFSPQKKNDINFIIEQLNDFFVKGIVKKRR
jgi:TetR/AcrR family fatty acid metabolism transcriptional regulator